jgi:hypothetical protein
MNLDLQWHRPINLLDGRRKGLIFRLPDEAEDSIPNAPGVYIFARRFGDIIAPLYIGQAARINVRIDQQFNNLRLMRGIEDAEIGRRVLLFVELHPRPGQQIPRALDIIEKALIRHALSEGYELLNIQGAKTPTHALKFRGNIEARSVFPRRMYVPVR